VIAVGDVRSIGSLVNIQDGVNSLVHSMANSYLYVNKSNGVLLSINTNNLCFLIE